MRAHILKVGAVVLSLMMMVQGVSATDIDLKSSKSSQKLQTVSRSHQRLERSLTARSSRARGLIRVSRGRQAAGGQAARARPAPKVVHKRRNSTGGLPSRDQQQAATPSTKKQGVASASVISLAPRAAENKRVVASHFTLKINNNEEFAIGPETTAENVLQKALQQSAVQQVLQERKDQTPFDMVQAYLSKCGTVRSVHTKGPVALADLKTIADISGLCGNNGRVSVTIEDNPAIAKDTDYSFAFQSKFLYTTEQWHCSNLSLVHNGFSLTQALKFIKVAEHSRGGRGALVLSIQEKQPVFSPNMALILRDLFKVVDLRLHSPAVEAKEAKAAEGKGESNFTLAVETYTPPRLPPLGRLGKNLTVVGKINVETFVIRPDTTVKNVLQHVSYPKTAKNVSTYGTPFSVINNYFTRRATGSDSELGGKWHVRSVHVDGLVSPKDLEYLANIKFGSNEHAYLSLHNAGIGRNPERFKSFTRFMSGYEPVLSRCVNLELVNNGLNPDQVAGLIREIKNNDYDIVLSIKESRPLFEPEVAAVLGGYFKSDHRTLKLD